MRRIILGLSIMILLSNANCSDKQKDSSSFKKNAAGAIDKSFLADSNFIYKNITNTSQVSFLKATKKGDGTDSIIYVDSTFKRRYKSVPANQRGYFLALFLPKNYGVKYAKELMYAWFVSKQNKIGDLQPIILQVEGNDYGSLTLMILDKNDKPISEFSLDEENPLPQYPDSLNFTYDFKSYSKVNKNEITSYRITEIQHKDPAKKQVIIDSNVFKSVINKDGTITTKQIVKTKYTRLSK